MENPAHGCSVHSIGRTLLKDRRDWAAHRKGEHQKKLTDCCLVSAHGEGMERSHKRIQIRASFATWGFLQVFLALETSKMLSGIPAWLLLCVHTSFKVTHQSTRTKSERHSSVFVQCINCILKSNRSSWISFVQLSNK